MAELRAEIADLRRLRVYSSALLLVFLVAPLIAAVPIYVLAEGPTNPELSDYGLASQYALSVALRSPVSNVTVRTPIGRTLTVVLSFLNLVFFGFIASIVATSVQIQVKRSNLPIYLKGKQEPKKG